MSILIRDKTDGIFNEEHKKIIDDVINTVLQIENVNSNPEISVLIVNDAEIQKLNKKFRMIDNPTDVLSFPLIDFNTSDENILQQKNILLGDIVISIDKVFTQAREYFHSFQRELAFLTAHGVLHLLGYDHIKPDDEKIMFAKQKIILLKVGLER